MSGDAVCAAPPLLAGREANLIQVFVRAKYSEAEDICVFELAPCDGAVLPPFDAGAHIDVHIREGLVRQYSLCNAPQQDDVYVIGVLREAASRGGSVAMHELRVGQTLHISAPRNHFPMAQEAPSSLLFAGGIGITPLLSKAERLAEADADFHLHYCTRSRGRTAFFDRIVTSDFADRASFHFDTGQEEQKLDLDAALAAATPGTHLYVCGPAGFMDWVLAEARARGWPESRLHKEYFAAAPVQSGDDRPFDVTIASTGATFRVAPGQTVVEVLQEHGIEIPISCEQGVCGTCLTRVLEGVPDHRDVFLTDAEKEKNDQFTPCCSRAKSSCLVLDL
ncbi:MAG TPA: PDR/VanB family oxidoreductase [Lysobacter sp.]|nr:PDR/VanB family oxidoreductase [Lysobacter sp.]